MALDPYPRQEPEVIELVHEELDGPELLGLVREMGRRPCAYLVVEDDGDTVGGVDLGVGDQVVVEHAWSGVKSRRGVSCQTVQT